MDAFPAERTSRSRSIPLFPQKKVFGSEPLDDRRRDMDAYVDGLAQMPNAFSQHVDVCRFMTQALDDQIVGAEAEGEAGFLQAEIVRNDLSKR